MNRTRLQIARPDIFTFFNEKLPHVLRERQIAAALSEQRAGWRLAQSTTVAAFISFLTKSGRLKRYSFEFPNRPETVYAWGDVPVLEVYLHLKAHSYYSHYTAMRMHGLTEQIPKILYISHERSTAAPRSATLTQDAIDDAFARPARASNNTVSSGSQRITLLNSANTSELGVVSQLTHLGHDGDAKVRVTDVERTLIDAAVRPGYCGGVFEVAKAFELAKDLVSVNTLGAHLSKLSFAYPHHQAIGFYLERAGYRPSALDLIRRFPMQHDFYLSHDMGETRYVPAWRLHVPKGF